MNCIKCDKEIPAERLEAKPDTEYCVPCLVADGDVPMKKGRMCYDHKTAGEIEIMSEERLHEINNLDPRGYYKSRTTQREVDDN